MCLVEWYLFLKFVVCSCVLDITKNLIFFVSFIISEYIKSFFFVFVVYYFIMLLPVVFLVRLHRVFIKSEFLDVGSGRYLSAANQPSIILIFKNLGVWGDGLLCLLCFVLSVFFERLCGLFVVVVLVIDFAVNWWDGFSCLFVMFCFLGVIDWMVAGIVCRDCLMWLIVPVGCFYWTVVILWEIRKIKVWRCIAMLLLLNPMSKWVRSDPCGCFFWFWWVLFVVKTFSCSERRFASGTS